MPKSVGTIRIRIADIYRRLEFNASRLRKMLSVLCRRFMVEQADISIAIVDDGHIKKVNKEFLGCSDVTDVISFDLSDEVSSGRMVELIVNAQEAQRQANKRRHSAEAELALYVVHGFLHNVGFDDAKRPQAQRMHSLEDEILKEFGYGITYHSETVAVRKAKERG